MAKTAQERAQERLDQLDERIATQLAELKQEREHAANAPALKPQEGQAGSESPVLDEAQTV